MAENRLESVISQTMDDSVIAKVMVKRFEQAYPELKTDNALRDKCADFIDRRINDEPDKEASFLRIAFLAKFSKAAIDYYDHEKEQKKTAAKPADEYSKFLEEYGLTDDQASQELYAQILQDKANGTVELVPAEPQTQDPRLAFLESMGLDNTEDNLLMAEEYLKSLENQPTEPMLKSAETNAEAQHEPTYIEKLYLDLNNVMDESYPLVKEYIDIYIIHRKNIIIILLNAPIKIQFSIRPTRKKQCMRKTICFGAPLNLLKTKPAHLTYLNRAKPIIYHR